jgi:hypothetical protein
MLVAELVDYTDRQQVLLVGPVLVVTVILLLPELTVGPLMVQQTRALVVVVPTLAVLVAQGLQAL